MQKVVTIGGGSGHAQVLRALKRFPDIAITAICGSTDSGGSTGILKRDYGSLGYLGDLTRCVSALCSDEEISQTLLHRFEGGCLHEHSAKNILLLAFEQTHTPEHALELMHRMCGISTHRVMPVTREPTKLWARLKAGNEIEGETNIDNLNRNPLWNPAAHAIQRVFLKPMVHAAEPAIQAILEASYCVICPGDLYSSIIPVLLPEGMTDAFKRSPAKIIIMLNIMTKNGETNSYHAEDFIDRIEAKLGKGCDIVLLNNSEIKEESQFRYGLEKKVQLRSSRLEGDRRLVKARLVSSNEKGRLIHSPEKIAEVFGKLLA